jgi:predicted acyl esterase
MTRALVALLVAVAALLLAGPVPAATRTDVAIPMDDGVSLAATLVLPDGPAPPGGRPAIVFLHGLAGNRAQTLAIAEQYGFAGGDYAVLAFDARGHGDSGGLVSINGPREIADTQAVFQWLAARPDVADAKIGAWGISYGGGAILNSLAAGVPWAAVEVAETWTDLYEALVPQGLVKSGLVAGLAGSIPDARKAPEVSAIQAAAFAGTASATVRAWAAARSSLGRLAGVRTPVFFMQGRRDFLFGLDQASRAFARLAGPKRLWIGNHGHAPSTFPAVDTAAMLREGRQWFDRFLRGVDNGIDRRPRVFVAAEGRATGTSFSALPQTGKVTVPLGTPRVTARKVVATSAQLAASLEVLGSPLVRVTATTSGGWARLVAVLTARTPAGKEIVVSAGGVPARNGTRTYAIRLVDQATVLPARSRLTVTIGSSTLAQSPGNILYLELPQPRAARIAAVRAVGLTLPTLVRPSTT